MGIFLNSIWSQSIDLHLVYLFLMSTYVSRHAIPDPTQRRFRVMIAIISLRLWARELLIQRFHFSMVVLLHWVHSECIIRGCLIWKQCSPWCSNAVVVWMFVVVWIWLWDVVGMLYEECRELVIDWRQAMWTLSGSSRVIVKFIIGCRVLAYFIVEVIIWIQVILCILHFHL